jgi:ABC-2 type transport system permease protein
MKRAIADLKAFGIQFLRSKVGTFFVFIFPILLILLFGAIFSGGGAQEITLNVQDVDDSVASHNFIEILNFTGAVNVEYIPNNVDIESYITENSLSIALLIPEGFQENLTIAGQQNITGTVVNVTLYGDPSQSTYSIALSVVGGSIEAMNDIMNPTNRAPLGMKAETVAPDEFKFIDFFLPGVVGLTVMTTPMFAMSSICAEYRNRGYFKLLGSTPLTKSEWLLSKILWYIMVLYVSFALMLLLGILAFNIKMTITLLAIVLIAVGALLFTSMGMLIGAFTKNPETSAAIANAVGFPMMFLSGTFFPLEGMPEYLQLIASGLPLTYLNEGLRDTMIYGNTSSALTNLAVVLVIAVIFFILAAKVMRWKEK